MAADILLQDSAELTRLRNDLSRRAIDPYAAAESFSKNGFQPEPILRRYVCRFSIKLGASFDRLVEQVMTQAPYRTAQRVFWILDNGSAHRGQRCITRLQGRYPNLIVVHAPVHASWLNQIEIYFSIPSIISISFARADDLYGLGNK